MNEKIKTVLQGLLFIFIIIAFIYVGSRDYTTKVVVDNERFDIEYENVDKDNVFVYASAQDVYTKFKNGSAIVFMGFPENIWSGYYADILNDAAKEVGINEILYYNFKEDRDAKNATYQSIVLKLTRYNYTLDDGKQNIYAPTLVIIKNGKIVAYDNETAVNMGLASPDNYWTELQKEIKLNHFKMMFQEYMS